VPDRFRAGGSFAYLILPAFNAAFNAGLTLSFVLRPGPVAVVVGMFALVTGIAGGYPAWQMARFNPVAVLKGRLTLKRPGFFAQFPAGYAVCNGYPAHLLHSGGHAAIQLPAAAAGGF
jgi:hypothetical protein